MFSSHTYQKDSRPDYYNLSAEESNYRKVQRINRIKLQYKYTQTCFSNRLKILMTIKVMQNYKLTLFSKAESLRAIENAGKIIIKNDQHTQTLYTKADSLFNLIVILNII